MDIYINPIITANIIALSHIHTHTHETFPNSQAQFRYVKAMDNLEKFIDINYRRKNNFRGYSRREIRLSRY